MAGSGTYDRGPIVEVVGLRGAVARDHAQLHGSTNAIADGHAAQDGNPSRRRPLRTARTLVQLLLRGRRYLLRLHRRPHRPTETVSRNPDWLVDRRAGVAIGKLSRGGRGPRQPRQSWTRRVSLAVHLPDVP